MAITTTKDKDIHRAGRKPTVRPKEFYELLLKNYETHTTRQLAALYHVCPATVNKWLKKAREVCADE